MIDFLNALVALSNFVIVPAIAYGSQLALGALGVTLIYGILRFSNFAHGDTMASGAMFTIFITWWMQSAGINLGPLPTALLALPFGILGCMILVLFTDRFVYRFYRAQKALHHQRARIQGNDRSARRAGDQDLARDYSDHRRDCCGAAVLVPQSHAHR